MFLIRIIIITLSFFILTQYVKANEIFTYFNTIADKAAKKNNHKKAIKYYHTSYRYSQQKKEKERALEKLVISYQQNKNTRSANNALKLLLDISPKNSWALKQKNAAITKKSNVKFDPYYANASLSHRKKIQESLIWVSDYNGLIDGQFGKRTSRSIKKWQLENFFNVDGILTKTQKKKLLSQANSIKKKLKWKKYTSLNNFYTIYYPNIFQIKKTRNHSNGSDLTSKKNRYSLEVMVFNKKEAFEDTYKQLKNITEKSGWKKVYNIQKKNWFVIAGTLSDGGLAYTKFVKKGEITIGYVFVIYLQKGDSYEALSRAIIVATANSFKIDWRYATPYLRSLQSKTRKKKKKQSKNQVPEKLYKRLPAPKIGHTSKGALSAEKVFSKVNTSVWVLISKNTQGSAVAIHKNYLLTNCHVLNGGKYTITNTNISANALNVHLYAANKALDRCVLYSKKDLPSYVSIRPYLDLTIGEKVFSIGTPQGLSLTIAEGLLSAKRIDKNIRYLQTSAPISQGSSGGGLFDSYGNLLGITTMMVASGQNLNFAIPADDYWNNQ
ncbi:MAG: trypsin-like peptidase domain-containing protein [Cocleimonas sp.]|nr:trypsin-like peptidase domain-containing protein [Cocleimonas sp.]